MKKDKRLRVIFLFPHKPWSNQTNKGKLIETQEAAVNDNKKTSLLELTWQLKTILFGTDVCDRYFTWWKVAFIAEKLH